MKQENREELEQEFEKLEKIVGLIRGMRYSGKTMNMDLDTRNLIDYIVDNPDILDVEVDPRGKHDLRNIIKMAKKTQKRGNEE